MLKNILLASTICFILTLTASAQIPPFPCVNQDGSPAAAGSLVYKIPAGRFEPIVVWMPVAGNCRIEFTSYDDRSDGKRTLTDAAGKVTGLADHAKGDIEIMFLDPFNRNQFQRNQRFAAAWSTGRKFEGKFDAPLQAGIWHLIINNRFSSAEKSVEFKIGHDKTLAPIFAPTNPQTTTNERNYSDSDDPPPTPKPQ